MRLSLAALGNRVVLPLVAVGILVFGLVSARRLPPSTHLASVSVSQDLHSCVTKAEAGERFACFRVLLHPRLDAQGPRAVLQDLDTLQTANASFGAYCHEMAHILGRYWIAKGRSLLDGLREGSSVCHSGFYHGMVERVIQGESTDRAEVEHISPDDLRAKVPTVCTAQTLGTESRNFRFQCLHGLGHAVVFALGYRLPSAVELCDTLEDDWSRHSCYGGAFMENITGPERDRRMLRAGDPHYPCSMVAEKYRDSCYGMQTSWMREMGLSFERIVEECRTVKVGRLSCFRSLGRDASSDVRQEGPTKYSSLCASLPPEERTECIQGVVYALADHTWDGRYANAFCASFAEAERQEECFGYAHQHLTVALEQPVEKVANGCRALASSPDVCLRVLANQGSGAH